MGANDRTVINKATPQTITSPALILCTLKNKHRTTNCTDLKYKPMSHLLTWRAKCSQPAGGKQAGGNSRGAQGAKIGLYTVTTSGTNDKYLIMPSFILKLQGFYKLPAPQQLHRHVEEFQSQNSGGADVCVRDVKINHEDRKLSEQQRSGLSMHSL